MGAGRRARAPAAGTRPPGGGRRRRAARIGEGEACARRGAPVPGGGADPGEAVAAQTLAGEPAAAASGGLASASSISSTVAERGTPASSKPSRAASSRRTSALDLDSPTGAIAGLVPRQVREPPRPDEVGVLEHRRRRQHDVGVPGGVGEELVVDDGEQVVAAESARARAAGRRRSRQGCCSRRTGRGSGGSSSGSVSARPSWIMLTCGCRAGRGRAARGPARSSRRSTRCWLMPPAGQRHWPVSAGRHWMARSADAGAGRPLHADADADRRPATSPRRGRAKARRSRSAVDARLRRRPLGRPRLDGGAVLVHVRRGAPGTSRRRRGRRGRSRGQGEGERAVGAGVRTQVQVGVARRCGCGRGRRRRGGRRCAGHGGSAPTCGSTSHTGSMPHTTTSAASGRCSGSDHGPPGGADQREQLGPADGALEVGSRRGGSSAPATCRTRQQPHRPEVGVAAGWRSGRTPRRWPATARRSRRAPRPSSNGANSPRPWSRPAAAA